MTKFIFSGLILIHGLIHLLGFVKAFGWVHVEQLSKDISKPSGMLWLTCAVLFIAVMMLYFSHHHSWAFLAVIAILISQSLIILSWSDAKFGTIANVVILIMAVPSIGKYFFDKTVREEQMAFVVQVSELDNNSITADDLNHLPNAVKKWLKRSGVMERKSASFIRLKQKGQMRTKPNGPWMDFNAVQYIDPKRASFIWNTQVLMMPMISLSGRDKLIDGKGHMMIKLLSVIPIVNEGPNDKINTGSMLRYLGEMCWIPSAALNRNIRWKELSSHSAQATLNIDGVSVQGIYHFDDEGRPRSFEAERYFGGGKDAKLEKWVVDNTDFKIFDGVLIPYKSKVIWRLKGGDFHWLNLEIVDLEADIIERYPD